MEQPSDPVSPDSHRKPDALQKFYHHYPSPAYPSPIYQPHRSPGPYVHADNAYEDLEMGTSRHGRDSHRAPEEENRGSHGQPDVAISGHQVQGVNESEQSYPAYSIPNHQTSFGRPKLTPPSKSAGPHARMPLAMIPFFENLNTPSPPRRANHLVNRKTRFEREMDNLAQETQKKRERSPSVKKASALEGVDDDDKYVGPWVLGKVVGKGASGEHSAACLPSSVSISEPFHL